MTPFAPTLFGVSVVATVVGAGAGLVAPLDDASAIQRCAWTASAPTLGPQPVFMAERDDSKVLMHVDGADLPLALATESGRFEQVGDVMRRTYRAPGVTVKARYQVTRDGEVLHFSASFDVRKGKRAQVVRANGTVGCAPALSRNIR